MHLDIIHLNKRIDALNERLAWQNRMIAQHLKADNFTDLGAVASAAQKTKTTRDSLKDLVAYIERKRNVSLPKVAS